MLLDPHRHAEVLAQQLDETFGVAAARAEQAGLEAPCVLGKRARRIDRALRTVRRAEPCGEAVVVRPVVVDRRLRLRPGPVEEREQAMVEDVEKARQRGIAARAQPLAHVLGEVERHRPLRAEQAEEANAESRRRSRAGVEALERRGCERELRRLAEAHALLRRPQREADARLPGTQRLDVAQDGEEVVLARRRGDRFEERRQRSFAIACRARARLPLRRWRRQERWR